MNTATQLAVRAISPQIAFRAAVLSALFTLASVAAFADQPTARAPATRSAKVSLAGLDLSTPADARVAYERIKAVAERLCHQPGDPRNMYHQAIYNACVLEAVADTVRRINAPTLAALEK